MSKQQKALKDFFKFTIVILSLNCLIDTLQGENELLNTFLKSNVVVVENEPLRVSTVTIDTLPDNEAGESLMVQPPLSVKIGEFSAYTASEAETDSTPTITASNKKVQKGYIANNCLPFGSQIELNGEIYEVQDRMNKRYSCDNFDIFFEDYDEAIKFGRQSLSYVQL